MELARGVRLVQQPGALHFYDGRRVVSLSGDADTRGLVLAALGVPSSGSSDAISAASSGGAAAPGRPGDRAAADENTDTDAGSLLRRLGLAQTSPGGAPTASTYLLSTSARSIHWLHALRDAGMSIHVLPRDELPRAAREGAVVVAPADPAAPVSSLRTVNELCDRAGVTWLPIGGYDGATLRVGPLVIPGHTACYLCLQTRLAANTAFRALYGDVADLPSAPEPPGLFAWAVAVACHLVTRWCVYGDGRVPGRVVTIDPDEFDFRHATVFRVPRCVACQAPDHVVKAAPWGVADDH